MTKYQLAKQETNGENTTNIKKAYGLLKRVFLDTVNTVHQWFKPGIAASNLTQL